MDKIIKENKVEQHKYLFRSRNVIIVIVLLILLFGAILIVFQGINFAFSM